MPDTPACYIAPQSLEPLMPESSRNELADLSCEIFLKSGKLSAQIPAKVNQRKIALIMQEMNSYYSNLIEGHKTLPREIELALKQEYSGDDLKRANQHIARAHVLVEQLMLKKLVDEPNLSIHSKDFILWIHREFYQLIPPELHYSETRSGKRYKIEPGELRSFEVKVGHHQPPHYGSLPQFMELFCKRYSNSQILSTNQLVALAAAHHRLVWIHPFGDGNGRVTRLYSHACLIRCKVDGLGLWTLSRGLARFKSEYYEFLQCADSPRLNDYDGRGNLSDKGLAKFCLFFLKTILDQIVFMTEVLDLENLSKRIERFIQRELVHLEGKDVERIARILKAALFEGEIERGQAAKILGLSATGARKIIQLALDEKLLETPSKKGHLSLCFSSKTTEDYFPKLFQDLPVL